MCYYPPGTDPGFWHDRLCHWGPEQAIITVQGDQAVVEHKRGNYVIQFETMLYVRLNGQTLAGQSQPTVDCVAKFCTSCVGSTSLLGATPADCELCKSRNATQINQCQQQGSSGGPGRYDTRGLPDPPVYCAYEVPQPNFNPSVRYEIGKCNDVHPTDQRVIFGPDTFTHCREWLVKKGFWK